MSVGSNEYFVISSLSPSRYRYIDIGLLNRRERPYTHRLKIRIILAVYIPSQHLQIVDRLAQGAPEVHKDPLEGILNDK